MGSSDSESEDERRVVRSAKDKAYDELRATCNEIKVRLPDALHTPSHLPVGSIIHLPPAAAARLLVGCNTS